MSGRRLFWIVLPILVVAMVLNARRGGARWMASFQLQQVENLVTRLQAEGHLQRKESQRGIALAFGEAIKMLRGAQELDPSKVEVLAVRGGLHRLLNRPRAALETYEVALELEPRPEVFTQLGHVYRALGRTEEAREAYENAILLDHTLATALRPYLGGKRKRAKGKHRTDAQEATDNASRGEKTDE